MKFHLILVSIFLTLFKISDSTLSITFGDLISLVLLVWFIIEFNKYRINHFSRYWIYYVLILTVSSILNLTFFEGPFLNIFRTNIFSLIYFVIIYDLVYKGSLKLNNYLLGLTALAILFLLQTWPEMQKAWDSVDAGFTNFQVFKSSLNLNTWGFVLVLFLFAALYSLIKTSFKKLSILFVLILSFFIFFSYSRTVYSLFILIIIIFIFGINTLTIKRMIASSFFLLMIAFAALFLNIIHIHIPDAAQSFLDRKASTFENDLIETRFFIINIKPILEKYQEFNIIQMVFGDGMSVQHSFVSHTLVVSGFLGFIVYLKRFFYAIKYSLRNLKTKTKKIESKFLILILVVVLLSDFITNLSSFLPFAAYLSSILIAYFFAELDKSKNDKKYYFSD